MAKAVDIRFQPRPAEEQLERRLQAAPLEHADAVLNAYRTLQTLHDTKTLDFVRGLLGAGDEVLTQVTSVITTPQSMQAIRNLLVLIDLAGKLNPEALHRVIDGVTPILTAEPAANPPSLFATGRKLLGSKDARRALAMGVALLEAVGGALGPKETRQESGGGHKL